MNITYSGELCGVNRTLLAERRPLPCLTLGGGAGASSSLPVQGHHSCDALSLPGPPTRIRGSCFDGDKPSLLALCSGPNFHFLSSLFSTKSTLLGPSRKPPLPAPGHSELSSLMPTDHDHRPPTTVVSPVSWVGLGAPYSAWPHLPHLRPCSSSLSRYPYPSLLPFLSSFLTFTSSPSSSHQKKNLMDIKLF